MLYLHRYLKVGREAKRETALVKPSKGHKSDDAGECRSILVTVFREHKAGPSHHERPLWFVPKKLRSLAFAIFNRGVEGSVVTDKGMSFDWCNRQLRRGEDNARR